MSSSDTRPCTAIRKASSLLIEWMVTGLVIGLIYRPLASQLATECMYENSKTRIKAMDYAVRRRGCDRVRAGFGFSALCRRLYSNTPYSPPITEKAMSMISTGQ